MKTAVKTFKSKNMKYKTFFDTNDVYETMFTKQFKRKKFKSPEYKDNRRRLIGYIYDYGKKFKIS